MIIKHEKTKLMLLFATKKGFKTLEHIRKKFPNIVGCVSTFPDVDVRENWNSKIINYCKYNKINYIDSKRLKINIEDYILKYKITNIIAIGWKYLLPVKLNKILRCGIIVIHDSLLPKYRGFAPTPTAIMCGEKKVGISIIFADNYIDNGDIIIQKSVQISDNDYIADIIDKLIDLYKKAIDELIPMINKNKFRLRKQDAKLATYSIWRNVLDCRIDWCKSNIEIYNLIRAVSTPYIGACTYMNGKKIIINKAKKEKFDLKFAIRDTGKIWSTVDNMPIVLCGKGLLKILDASYENCKKVIFNKIRMRFI